MEESQSKYGVLASKYPELVGESRFGGFCIGEGWFNIIDRLCGMIYYQVTHTMKMLNTALHTWQKIRHLCILKTCWSNGKCLAFVR